MNLKHSVMIGFMGRQFDRFHEYQPAQDLARRLEMAKQVKDADGIEPVYPNDFADIDTTLKLIRDTGLPVSAVNVNVKGDRQFRTGSFSSPDPAVRRSAVDYVKTGMDLAAELGAEMITVCTLIDGHNYNFEADYLKQWCWMEEGLAEAARHRSDIRVSLEYKPNESRNYIVIGDMGRSLYMCERLGLPNVGVTMDVGHALVAKETPAEMLAIAGLSNRLFYVHFNDNGREWDWDMLPASVNLWDTLEMLFYMDRLNWNGWLAYDVVTRDGDPVETMSASIEIVKTAEKLLEKMGREQLQACIEEGIPARTFQHMVRSLL
ncbi:MAG: TIM barrel protein [Caldilineaceae bacterium]|nr:TIM barrel protein [Caldilineaceae bacterium]